MGIDVGASILVGRPKDDLEELAEVYEDFGDYIEDKGLDILSPYFDACEDDSYYGVCVYNIDYTYQELPESFIEDIDKARKRFKELTGIDGKLVFGPDVW